MLWRKFVTWKSDVKVRWQTKIIALLMIGILLCGFTWGWTVEFVASVLFPAEDAMDFEMVLDFPKQRKVLFQKTSKKKAEKFIIWRRSFFQ